MVNLSDWRENKEYKWDGKNNSGKLVVYGRYKVKIKAKFEGAEIESNEYEFTVYQINVGNVVYYDILFGVNEHAGIVYTYIGKNRLNYLQNDDKYVIWEIRGKKWTVGATRTLKEFKKCSHYEDIYCPPGLTREERKNIIAKCQALAGLPYVDNFIAYILQYKGDTWEGTISDIKKIRCDRVVEVAYEDNFLRLFGCDEYWNIMVSDWANLNHHNAQCTPEDQRHGNLTTNAPSKLYFP